MPHENIDSAFGFGRVQVIWRSANHDPHADEAEMGYVQVMSEDPNSIAMFPGSPASEADDRCDDSTKPPGGDTGYPPAQCTGFAVMLDRDGINRMIRQLRRARDAAFGLDA